MIRLHVNDEYERIALLIAPGTMTSATAWSHMLTLIILSQPHRLRQVIVLLAKVATRAACYARIGYEPCNLARRPTA